jgi:pimeloyl-ACP methyl ester carboxylesterase
MPFTVVAPSLPGYALSIRPGQKRFGVEEIADCLVALMTDTLGYRRFAVQGGDWGGITTSRVGLFARRKADRHPCQSACGAVRSHDAERSDAGGAQIL